MAKRFTDTDKYKKEFIKSLQGAYKVLWDYLYHDCNHAGIWHVDFEIAQIYVGKDMPINKKEALKVFNNGEKRIVDLGSKWFLVPFIEFQYGVLKPDNRVHESVIKELLRNGVDKGLVRSLQGRKDKDKDKDKEKDKEKGGLLRGFFDRWNERMPFKCRKLTDERREHLKARLEQKDFSENFGKIMDLILASDFLTGRKPSKSHPNFKADFDWVIKNSTNYIKVLEGKYENQKRDILDMSTEELYKQAMGER